MSDSTPSMVNTPIVNFMGDTVALGPMSRELVPTLTRWMNDFTLRRTLSPNPPGPVMPDAEERWVNSLETSSDKTFVIRERASMRPIGTTDLSAIDYRNRCATFGINIGEEDARGRGFGTETTRLMLDYAFTVLGLHTVGLGVAAYNHGAIRAYEKAGFQTCGRWRERWWFAGRLWDHVLMDCLATEFRSPVLADVFSTDAIARTAKGTINAR